MNGKMIAILMIALLASTPCAAIVAQDPEGSGITTEAVVLDTTIAEAAILIGHDTKPTARRRPAASEWRNIVKRSRIARAWLIQHGYLTERPTKIQSALRLMGLLVLVGIASILGPVAGVVGMVSRSSALSHLEDACNSAHEMSQRGDLSHEQYEAFSSTIARLEMSLREDVGGITRWLKPSDFAFEAKCICDDERAMEAVGGCPGCGCGRFYAQPDDTVEELPSLRDHLMANPQPGDTWPEGVEVIHTGITPVTPPCPECGESLKQGGHGSLMHDPRDENNLKHIFVTLFCGNDGCDTGWFGRWDTTLTVPTDAQILSDGAPSPEDMTLVMFDMYDYEYYNGSTADGIDFAWECFISEEDITEEGRRTHSVEELGEHFAETPVIGSNATGDTRETDPDTGILRRWDRWVKLPSALIARNHAGKQTDEDTDRIWEILREAEGDDFGAPSVPDLNPLNTFNAFVWPLGLLMMPEPSIALLCIAVTLLVGGSFSGGQPHRYSHAQTAFAVGEVADPFGPEHPDVGGIANDLSDLIIHIMTSNQDDLLADEDFVGAVEVNEDGSKREMVFRVYENPGGNGIPYGAEDIEAHEKSAIYTHYTITVTAASGEQPIIGGRTHGLSTRVKMEVMDSTGYCAKIQHETIVDVGDYDPDRTWANIGGLQMHDNTLQDQSVQSRYSSDYSFKTAYFGMLCRSALIEALMIAFYRMAQDAHTNTTTPEKVRDRGIVTSYDGIQGDFTKLAAVSEESVIAARTYLADLFGAWEVSLAAQAEVFAQEVRVRAQHQFRTENWVKKTKQARNRIMVVASLMGLPAKMYQKDGTLKGDLREASTWMKASAKDLAFWTAQYVFMDYERNEEGTRTHTDTFEPDMKSKKIDYYTTRGLDWSNPTTHEDEGDDVEQGMAGRGVSKPEDLKGIYLITRANNCPFVQDQVGSTGRYTKQGLALALARTIEGPTLLHDANAELATIQKVWSDAIEASDSDPVKVLAERGDRPEWHLMGIINKWLDERPSVRNPAWTEWDAEMKRLHEVQMDVYNQVHYDESDRVTDGLPAKPTEKEKMLFDASERACTHHTATEPERWIDVVDESTVRRWYDILKLTSEIGYGDEACLADMIGGVGASTGHDDEWPEKPNITHPVNDIRIFGLSDIHIEKYIVNSINARESEHIMPTDIALWLMEQPLDEDGEAVAWWVDECLDLLRNLRCYPYDPEVDGTNDLTRLVNDRADDHDGFSNPRVEYHALGFAGLPLTLLLDPTLTTLAIAGLVGLVLMARSAGARGSPIVLDETPLWRTFCEEATMPGCEGENPVLMFRMCRECGAMDNEHDPNIPEEHRATVDMLSCSRCEYDFGESLMNHSEIIEARAKLAPSPLSPYLADGSDMPSRYVPDFMGLTVLSDSDFRDTWLQLCDEWYRSGGGYLHKPCAICEAPPYNHRCYHQISDKGSRNLLRPSIAICEWCRERGAMLLPNWCVDEDDSGTNPAVLAPFLLLDMSLISWVILGLIGLVLRVYPKSMTAHPSLYDSEVSARDLHHSVPPKNPDGFVWSDEQFVILNDFAWMLEMHIAGDRENGPRMVIDAVAGSGKTTLLMGMLDIVRVLDSGSSTIASAFNRHISQTLKEVLIEQKEKGFSGATVIGHSNSVQAGGYSILRAHAKRLGIGRVEMEGDVGRYTVFSRQVWSEWLGVQPDLGQSVLITIIAGVDMKKANSRKVWFKVVRDLKALATVLQDEGFNPTTGGDDADADADADAITLIVKRVGHARGLDDSSLWLLPPTVGVRLAREVLIRGRDFAFDTKEVFPFANLKGQNTAREHGTSDFRSLGDVVVPRPFRHPRSKFHPDPGKFDTTLYPLWKLATAEDKKDRANERYKWANELQLIWPVRGDSNGARAVSVAPEGTPACKVSVTKSGSLKILFRDGQAATVKMDGMQAHRWLRSRPGWSSDYPRGQAHYINDTPEHRKALEQKFKNLKGGYEFDDGRIQTHEDQDDDAAEDAGRVVFAFADQTWIPHVLGLRLSPEESHDVAFVDEVQDLSVTKGGLVRAMVNPTSTLVLVGDEKQAIYGWSGADSESLQSNARLAEAVSYPMTFCWRGTHNVAAAVRYACSKAVKVAKSMQPEANLPDYNIHRSPDIEGWQKGPMMTRIDETQIVRTVKWIQSSFKDSEEGEEPVSIAIVSRLNGALGMVAVSLLKEGIAISTPAGDGGVLSDITPILTKDYAKPSNRRNKVGIALDSAQISKWADIQRRLEQVEEWCWGQALDRAGGDMTAAGSEERYVKEQDSIELAGVLLKMWFDTIIETRSGRGSIPLASQNQVKVEAFKKWVKNTLFSDEAGSVLLSSVHRIKGGQADVVLVLREVEVIDRKTKEKSVRSIFLLEHAMKAAPETAREEVNIVYVAYSRARTWVIEVLSSESLRAVPVEANLSAAIKAGSGDLEDLKAWQAVLRCEGGTEAIEEEAEEAEEDLLRCCECSQIIFHERTISGDGDDYATCPGCDGALCNRYTPERGSYGKGGILSNAGKLARNPHPIIHVNRIPIGPRGQPSCGVFLAHSFSEMRDKRWSRSSRISRIRYCPSCYEAKAVEVRIPPGDEEAVVTPQIPVAPDEESEWNRSSGLLDPADPSLSDVAPIEQDGDGPGFLPILTTTDKNDPESKFIYTVDNYTIRTGAARRLLTKWIAASWFNTDNRPRQHMDGTAVIFTEAEIGTRVLSMTEREVWAKMREREKGPLEWGEQPF